MNEHNDERKRGLIVCKVQRLRAKSKIIIIKWLCNNRYFNTRARARRLWVRQNRFFALKLYRTHHSIPTKLFLGKCLSSLFLFFVLCHSSVNNMYFGSISKKNYCHHSTHSRTRTHSITTRYINTLCLSGGPPN